MRSFKKIAIIVIVMVAVYALVGFFMLPLALRHFGEKSLQKHFNESSRIEAVRFNPFNWKLEVEGFTLVATNEQWSAEWALASLNLSARSLVKFYPVFDAVSLDAPDLYFSRRLGDSPDAPDARGVQGGWRPLVDDLNQADIPRVHIDRLKVRSGRARFEDQTTGIPYEQDFDALNFSLENFTTEVEGATELRFAAATPAGASLVWEGDFWAQPLASQGTVKLQGVEIHELSPYYQNLLRFDLERAIFGMDFSYDLDLSRAEDLLRIEQGSVELSELRCMPLESEERIIAIQSARMEGVGFRFPEMNLSVNSFNIRDGETRVVRGPKGKINLMHLIVLSQNDGTVEKAAAQPTDQSPEEGSNEFSFEVGKVSLADYRVLWVDSLESGQVSLEIGIPRASFKNVSSDFSAPVDFTSNYRIGSGRASVAGTVTPGTGELALDLSVEAVPLTLGAAYARESAQLDLRAGQLNFEGRLSGGGPAALSLGGNGSITGLDAAGLAGMDSSFGWETLGLEELELTLNPFDLRLARVRLDQLRGEFARMPQSGASGPSPKPDGTEPSETRAESKPDQLPVSIQTLEVRGGNFSFTDEVVSPTSRFELGEFMLTLKDLDLSDDSPTQVDLSTQLNGAGIDLSGELFPIQFRDATRVKLRLSELSLSEFSAYSGQAIGRRIAKGRLNLDSEWSLTDSQLDAENAISISGFELGDQVEGEDTLNLPLDLAITLLKGPGGVIDISLPVSGNLSDPEFSFGQIVRTAIVGLVTNIASSPFKLLSGLVGTEQDLSSLEFEAGASALTSQAVDELNALAEAMKKRPELRLQVIPQMTPADLKHLKRARFEVELFREAQDPKETTFKEALTKRYQAKLEREGRTPEDPPTTDTEEGIDEMLAEFLPEVILPESNQRALAESRGEAVVAHLTTVLGIAPERITVKGYQQTDGPAGVRFEVQ